MWLTILILIGIFVGLIVLSFVVTYFFGSTQVIYKGMCGDQPFSIVLTTTNYNPIEVGPQTNLQITYAPNTETIFSDQFGYAHPKGIETLVTLPVSPSTVSNIKYWDIVFSGSDVERKNAQDFATCIQNQSNKINAALLEKGEIPYALGGRGVIQIRSVGYLENLYGSNDANSQTITLPQYKFTCDDTSYLRISSQNVVSYVSSGESRVGYIDAAAKTFYRETDVNPGLEPVFQKSLSSCKNPDGKTLLDLFPQANS